jgi:hypothetical protein
LKPDVKIIVAEEVYFFTEICLNADYVHPTSFGLKNQLWRKNKLKEIKKRKEENLSQYVFHMQVTKTTTTIYHHGQVYIRNIYAICWGILLGSITIWNKGNNKITELRTILQRESQNS